MTIEEGGHEILTVALERVAKEEPPKIAKSNSTEDRAPPSTNPVAPAPAAAIAAASKPAIESALTSDEKFPLGEWVDVLRLVDTDKMAVSGNWSRNGQEITVEPGAARIAIPVVIKGSYDLEVDFTRNSGNNAVDTVLPIGSHQCFVILSGWDGRVSGLENLSGYAAIDARDPIAVRPGNLQNGHRYRLLVSARIDSDDHASVDVWLDGKPYLPHWAGDPAVLSLEPGWLFPNPRGLGLAAAATGVTFHSARLKMRSGSASLDPTLVPTDGMAGGVGSLPDKASTIPGVGSGSESGGTNATGLVTPSAGPAADSPVAPAADDNTKSADISAIRSQGAFACRTDKYRGGVSEQFGGTKETERAVAAALDWLAKHQTPQGNWSLEGYTQMCKDATCTGVAKMESLSAATAMGVLPFLAAGQTQSTAGPFKNTIAGGINWLVAHQNRDGDLSANAVQQMYSHGMATIALCEDYGITHDSRVGAAARKAVSFIEAAQNQKTGGWRYHPGEEGDTSVLGWQLMALKAAQMAGLSVKPTSLKGAKTWLQSCSTGNSGKFSYQPAQGPTPSMSAVGVLCSQYLHADRANPIIVGGVQFLMANQPDRASHNIYYWYYATQAMHNMADKEWETWNHKVQEILVSTQDREGCAAGSWDAEKPNRDAWGPQGGRIMMTSLSCLTLEVYYRYLPVYVSDASTSGRSSSAGEAANMQKTAGSPADAIQPNSVWRDGNKVLTILERKGDAFRARFDVGQGIVREVTGPIKDDKLSWLAKDVRAVRGGPGGDNFGTIHGDSIDFTWRTDNGASGQFILVRAK